MPIPLRALAVLVLTLSGLQLPAQTSFIYRGTLQQSGRPANGAFDLRFTLAESLTGRYVSSPFTNTAVSVNNGLFSVTLDFGGEVFNGPRRWLEIGVRPAASRADFTVLSPRQELLPTPYAIHARTADRAADLDFGGAFLWNVPATSLTGSLPLDRLSGITSRQIDPATDALYRSVDTNAVRALVQTTSGQGRITPFDFGAKGDGVTDDTQALQDWIDAAQNRNLIAELPPAPAFYRITDSLQVRHAGGLTLIGAGGQSHITGGPPYTRCRIHQVTPGRHGLVVTNITGTATPTDNVFLQGFMVTAEEYSPDSHGIAFRGGAPDTDANVIMNVAARNFGSGLFNAAACNMSVISCSFSYCGDGIQLNGPVVNSVLIQSTICTGNRSNGLHVISARNVTFDTGDLVTWRTDKAHLATIRSGLVSFRNLNGEHGSQTEAIVIGSHRPDAHVILDSGMILLFNAPTTNTYSLSISNAGSVLVHGLLLYSRTTDGFPIIEYQSPPATLSLRPLPERVVVNGRMATNWLGNYVRTTLPYFDGSSVKQNPTSGGLPHAGLLSTLNTPEETELLFSANLSRYHGGSGPEWVPLLQYAKDKLSSMTVSNLTVTGVLNQTGSSESSFASYPGLITRVTCKNGAITGAFPEEWDPDAWRFIERARLGSSPLESAAVDQLIKRLKAGHLWDLADAIYLFRGGTPESAALNLVSADYPILWSNAGPATFSRDGVVGDGRAFGLTALDPASLFHFVVGGGSLFTWVAHPGSTPAFFAGGQDANATFLLGGAPGVFGLVPGGAATNTSFAGGPVLLSHTTPMAGFILGSSFTNSFIATAKPVLPARLGVLAAADANGRARSPSTATLRCLWVGASLGLAQGRDLIAAFDEYFKTLKLPGP